MIPKIKFKYSYIYDDNWQIWKKAYPFDMINEVDTSLKPEDYSNLLNEKWNKISENVLNQISNTLNLEWKDKEIPTYFIREGIGFSDPLTIPIRKDIDLMLDILIHELIHQIFIQNNIINPIIKFKEKYYPKYHKKAVIHIILHAVLKDIYLNILHSEKRLERDIRKCQRNKPYKIAWYEVEKVGYKTIIENFKSFYK